MKYNFFNEIIGYNSDSSLFSETKPTVCLLNARKKAFIFGNVAEKSYIPINK